MYNSIIFIIFTELYDKHHTLNGFSLHFYHLTCYLAIKRNEAGSFVETWLDLESVIPSEVSQKEKNRYHILTYYTWNLLM